MGESFAFYRDGRWRRLDLTGSFARVGPPLFAVLLLATTPPWPDDWDGLGFLAAVDGFDMDRLAPHPPGFPVYIACLRIAASALRDPMRAAAIVAAGSGVVSAWFLGRAASHAWGALAGGALPFAVLIAPLTWRCATAVGAEAPALACVSLALWGASLQCTREPFQARRGAFWLGVAIGLGLGVRVSWWPLFLMLFSLAPKGSRLVAVAAACAMALAWAVPFVGLAGPSDGASLLGAVLTEHAPPWEVAPQTPSPLARVAAVLRALLVDGLGVDDDLLGLALAAVMLVLTALGLEGWIRRGARGGVRVALVLVPYAVWLVAGQDVARQPRHALPLVVAAAAALTLAGTTSRRARACFAVWIALLGLRTAVDAYARRTTPPPGEQLVAWLRTQPSPSRTAVAGGASVRFLERTEFAGRALAARTLAELQASRASLDEPPERMLATGEVEGVRNVSGAVKVATFCRPPRIERRVACLDVFEVP